MLLRQAIRPRMQLRESQDREHGRGRALLMPYVVSPRIYSRTRSVAAKLAFVSANLDVPYLLRCKVLQRVFANGPYMTGARPAGECTCDRAATENVKPSGSTCACGARPASESRIRSSFSPKPLVSVFLPATHCSNELLDACSCEKASDGGILPTETDFTTKAAGA